MSSSNELTEAAENVAARLKQLDRRIVLAESCTAGLISATLGVIPGISRYLCGSAVVYREQTKIEWLAVNPQTLAEHTAVSQPATESIALGVLDRTKEADISLGITGHFGPNAPAGLDGSVFLAACRRTPTSIQLSDTKRILLTSESRTERQQEATLLALRFLRDVL